MAKLYPKFQAKIEGGRFVFYQPDKFKRYVTTSFKEGQDVTLSVSAYKKTRSLKANSYYWLILTVIADSTGHTPDEIHETLKQLHLPKRFIKYGQKEVELPPTTSTLTTDEFSEYLEKIIAEATSLGINVPIPEEV